MNSREPTLDQADSGYNDLGSWDYTYDAASNLLTAEQTGGMGHLDADRVYGYDTLHRLITAKLTDTQDWDAAVQQTTWYQYDDLGNRISHSERDASPIAYAHDRANRLTDWAGHAQAYDLAENVTLAFSAAGDKSYTYRYDHLNQLTAVYDATDTTRKAAFTYDALGRRIEHVNDALGRTTDYYFDGANELAEYRGSGDGDRMRYTVHGLAYIDERLMMMVDVAGTSNDRPYYYAQDRLYNVWAMIDRAGAIVERYAYDAYGLPLIRESAGRGDMDNDTLIDADPGTDKTRMLDARDGVIWDPRADMDDDGDVDDDDVLLWSDADNVWPESEPTVAQAFSDVGNPFMFQGVPHFALDTADDAETATLPLNHHRARFADPVTGRWGSRDSLGYLDGLNVYEYLGSSPITSTDAFGLFTPLGELGPPCEPDVGVPDRPPGDPTGGPYNAHDCRETCHEIAQQCTSEWGYGSDCADCEAKCIDGCYRDAPTNVTGMEWAVSTWMDVCSTIGLLEVDAIGAGISRYRLPDGSFDWERYKAERNHYVQHKNRKSARDASRNRAPSEKHSKPGHRGQRRHFHDARNRHIHHMWGKTTDVIRSWLIFGTGFQFGVCKTCGAVANPRECARRGCSGPRA
ncbi:MAG: hypothetical protein L6R00_21170 [Phycisphaerae bacterium]|nr:hypothetical protein [Phycisphaerae bacterium]